MAWASAAVAGIKTSAKPGGEHSAVIGSWLLDRAINNGSSCGEEHGSILYSMKLTPKATQDMDGFVRKQLLYLLWDEKIIAMYSTFQVIWTVSFDQAYYTLQWCPCFNPVYCTVQWSYVSNTEYITYYTANFVLIQFITHYSDYFPWSDLLHTTMITFLCSSVLLSITKMIALLWSSLLHITRMPCIGPFYYTLRWSLFWPSLLRTKMITLLWPNLLHT